MLDLPMPTLTRNESHVITITRATAWHHPIHLHGHAFRVMSHCLSPSNRLPG